MTTSPMHNLNRNLHQTQNSALGFTSSTNYTPGATAGTESSFTDARAKYLQKLQGMTKTPREQLNEYKKRNKPPVILKMKMVSGGSHATSASQGQPNILSKPVHVE